MKANKAISKYITTKYYKLKVWQILITFIGIIVISFIYINFIKNLTYKNIQNNIEELSHQTVAQLNLTITEQKRFVEIMVESINKEQFKEESEIFERFKSELENYHFTRLVILDKAGNGITSDGYAVKNYENIQEFFNQTSVYISENRPSTISNNQVNIYSKTFYFKGEELVLFATINAEDYKEILSRRLFNGQGGTYLVNNNGIALIDSFGIINENNVNLYEFIKSRYNIRKQHDINKIDTMAENIKKQKAGKFYIKLKKNTYFVHYEKVNINDWYVITVAPDNIIAKELKIYLSTSLALCFFINLILFGTFIYINIYNQKQNRKLHNIAYIDQVTLLGNENYFKEKGTAFLQNQLEDKYVITLDINKFKALNNIYGHDFCNNILKILGKNLINTLPENSIICRISNDVFAAIFNYKNDVKDVIKKILSESSNIMIENTQIRLNLAIGIYKIHRDDKDINKILDKAYIARAKIKGLYGENYYIFDKILENKLIEEQKIEADMENALKNGEFKILYQPKVFTKVEKIAGAEALVRWYKGENIIMPNKFIPLFEKNKFIIKLDKYVFEQVCKDMADWKEKYNYMPKVSVNVSKAHFTDENFIDEYAKIREKYNIDKAKIDLEITESATNDKDINILKVFENIKNKDFSISIDDFGTDYSSLSMLQNMPIDTIKIDKTFINQADLNNRNKNIIIYIIAIAKQIGLETVIEGVETKEQVDFIAQTGGDIIQGYYYSKPITKKEFENYFNNHR